MVPAPTAEGKNKLDVVALRGRLREKNISPPRTAKCGVTRRGKAELVICKRPGASKSVRWSGMVTCQSCHACPVCAARIRSRRASQVRAAVEEGRRQFQSHRWRMLTVTVRHDAGLPLRVLVKILSASWRRCRQRGTIQRIFKARVEGTIRAIEVTRGGNGWHPHYHILILTSEWSESEKLSLERAFAAAVEREAAKANVSFGRVAPREGVALRWSSTRATERNLDQTKYLAKLGWEMTGAGKGSPQWRIADAATRDVSQVTYWREYTDAMAGKRAIECDERAAEFANLHALRKQGEGDVAVDPHERRIEIGPFRLLTMKDAERRCPTVTRDVLVWVAHAGGESDDAVLAAFDACLRACYLSEHGRRGAQGISGTHATT